VSANDDEHGAANAPFLPIGHAEMTMFMRLLRDAAQRHGLCILVGFPSYSFCPFPTIWDRASASPLLMRWVCLTGTERRDGGGSPGPRPVLYVLERRHAVACARTGAGPRITDRGGASLTHMGALAAFSFLFSFSSALRVC